MFSVPRNISCFYIRFIERTPNKQNPVYKEGQNRGDEADDSDNSNSSEWVQVTSNAQDIKNKLTELIFPHFGANCTALKILQMKKLLRISQNLILMY